MRHLPVPAAAFLAVTLAFTIPVNANRPTSINAATQHQQPGYYCSFSASFINAERYVEGAPAHAECEDAILPHSPPWGNWGVTSNVGNRIDGDQFRGWKQLDGHGQWNSCKDDFPPPDPNHYNAAASTEQQTTSGEHWYGTGVFAKKTFLSWGCERFHGDTFVFYGPNWLELYELDKWDPDELVGELIFPDISVTLDCTVDDCFGESSWYTPSDQIGYNDDPYAEVKVYIEGEFIEISAPAPNPVIASTPSFLMQRTGMFFAPSLKLLAPTVGLPWLSSAGSLILREERPRRQVLSGEIEFLVTNIESEGPIEKATIAWVQDDIAGGAAIRNARTGPDGKALIQLGYGAYELLVFAEGYGSARAEVLMGSGAQSRRSIELYEAASISGTVVAEDGTPVADASIEIILPPSTPTSLSAENRFISVSRFSGIRSNHPDGSFHIRNVNPFESFSIRVTHPERGSRDVGPLALSPGERLSNVRIALE